MYNRDTNNNENYLLTDSKNHLFPKSLSLVNTDDWMWRENQGAGPNAVKSPFATDGGQHADPLKYSSNSYKEVTNSVFRCNCLWINRFTKIFICNLNK